MYHTIDRYHIVSDQKKNSVLILRPRQSFFGKNLFEFFFQKSLPNFQCTLFFCTDYLLMFVLDFCWLILYNDISIFPKYFSENCVAFKVNAKNYLKRLSFYFQTNIGFQLSILLHLEKVLDTRRSFAWIRFER